MYKLSQAPPIVWHTVEKQKINDVGFRAIVHRSNVPFYCSGVTTSRLGLQLPRAHSPHVFNINVKASLLYYGHFGKFKWWMQAGCISGQLQNIQKNFFFLNRFQIYNAFTVRCLKVSIFFYIVHRSHLVFEYFFYIIRFELGDIFIHQEVCVPTTYPYSYFYGSR